MKHATAALPSAMKGIAGYSSPPRLRSSSNKASTAAAVPPKKSNVVARVLEEEATEQVTEERGEDGNHMTDEPVPSLASIYAVLVTVQHGDTPFQQQLMQKVSNLTAWCTSLEKDKVQLQGQVGQLQGQVGQLQGQVGQLHEEIVQLRTMCHAGVQEREAAGKTLKDELDVKLAEWGQRMAKATPSASKGMNGGASTMRSTSSNGDHRQIFKVTNVPEDGKEQGEALAKLVQKTVLSALPAGKTMSFTIVDAFRLGKSAPDAEKPRLVQIKVATMWDAHSIINNRRYLKNTGVTIFDHLSPDEYAEYLQLKPKHAEALKAGKRAWFSRSKLFIDGKQVGVADA
jgi:hypothetical protein